MYTLIDLYLKTQFSSKLRHSAYLSISLLSCLLIVVLAIFEIRYVIHKKKIRWGLALLIVYLFLGIIYSLTYANYLHDQQQVMTPELVCTIADDAVTSYGPVKTFFKISKWPFSLTSFDYSKILKDKSVQEVCLFDLKRYTYFISYGLEIQEIEYNFAYACNRLIFPWNGLVAPVKISYGENKMGEILIYRIPRAAVDTVS